MNFDFSMNYPNQNHNHFGQEISRVVTQAIKQSMNPQNGHGIGYVLTHSFQHFVYPQFGNYNLVNGENNLDQNLVCDQVFCNDNKHHLRYRHQYRYDLNHKDHKYSEPNCGCDGHYFSHQ